MAEKMMGAAEEVVEILKPRTDKRRYRRLVLPNSLEVLLISDPDTDKCAASMDVRVGSFSDPDGLEGLAHFLEHMLFYASAKYPLEDSYSKYITEIILDEFNAQENGDLYPVQQLHLYLRLMKHLTSHGGSRNAFTSSEHTNYFFDVNTVYFDEALDRFAQFFIEPLMSSDATLREIKAVDSENQKNLLSDFWRMIQLQKHLCEDAHPYHKFSTGNWDTLEVKPRAKGLDTHKALKKFYEEEYSANLMHLVVYGKGDLDDLQNIVESSFGEIKNTKRNHSKFPGHPFTADHLQILVKTVPVEQGHKLRIIWPIMPSINYYKEGPCKYLGHLIGHGGEGSLFSILKMMGWATSLAAGEEDWTCEFSFFKVVIDLTDAGHDHMSNIVGLLFKYINIIKSSGIQEWIFDELMAICEANFRYQDKSPPIDYVRNIASNMQLYPPQDWLVASSVPSEFNPDVIKMVLKDLTPTNVRIFWESKKFEGCTSMIEPWYGTAYSVEKISDDIIQQWTLAASDENLRLPKANIFIPTDFELKDVAEKANHPVVLKESYRSRMWYKADTLFFTPKAYLKIDFICPESRNSPKASVLTYIFTMLLMDYLYEYAYDAQVAGLYYGICKADAGFQVTVVGYNHKMRILLETIMEKIAHFEVKQDRFYVIKEMVKREYENIKFQQPCEQASYYCSLILQEQWSWTVQLNVLPYLKVEDLEKFKRRMLSKTFVECYFEGNITPDEARSLIGHIEDVLFERSGIISTPLFASQVFPKRIVELEKGISCFYPVKGLNQNDGNSALVHYIQGEPDEFRFNVKLQLFCLIAKQPAFHQLRSVEQLGYITELMIRNDSGIHGCQFIIQSTVKDPAQLDMRVEAFLKMFESKLYEMTNDEYKSYVSALIDMKLEKHENLKEEASFYWREIADGTLKFDRRECEVDVLRELPTLQELIDFFDKYIKVGSLHRKSLSVQVFGGLHSSEFKKVKRKNDEPLLYHIDDIIRFRSSRRLYPSWRVIPQS